MGESFDSVTMAAQIVDYVRRYGGVSFVELEREIPGFKGDNALFFPSYPNVILWPWVSPEGTAALEIAVKEIEPRPTSLLVYMADGKVPDMEMAKKLKGYKTERWLPVTFSIRK